MDLQTYISRVRLPHRPGAPARRQHRDQHKPTLHISQCHRQALHTEVHRLTRPGPRAVTRQIRRGAHHERILQLVGVVGQPAAAVHDGPVGERHDHGLALAQLLRAVPHAHARQLGRAQRRAARRRVLLVLVRRARLLILRSAAESPVRVLLG